MSQVTLTRAVISWTPSSVISCFAHTFPTNTPQGKWAHFTDPWVQVCGVHKDPRPAKGRSVVRAQLCEIPLPCTLPSSRSVRGSRDDLVRTFTGPGERP